LFWPTEEETMADQHNTAGHPAMDYAEHEKTYQLFIGLTKWGTIFCVAIMVLMALTLL
jgi:hypothetical protein